MKLMCKKVVTKLIQTKSTISTAESCTGGMLSSSLTSIAGSSRVFNFGLITYSNKSKVKILKISKNTIKKYGAVSEQVCLAMVVNLNKIYKTNISISITGIAGPDGGTIKKPVGLVYIGIKKKNKVIVKKYLFRNKGRVFIQKAVVNESLRLIFSLLK
jgi:nicotinamide-nucleotide amidase